MMKTLFTFLTLGLTLSCFAQGNAQSFRSTDGNTYYLHSDGKYYGQPQNNASSRIIYNNQYQQPQYQQAARSLRTPTFRDQRGQTYYMHRNGIYYTYPENSQQRFHGEQRQITQSHQPRYQQSCPYNQRQFQGLNNFRQITQHQNQNTNLRSRMQQLAKQKADYLASQSAVQFVRKRDGSMGVIGLEHPHFGRDLAGARHEGVGFSTAGPQAAINKCCHSGHCTSAKKPSYQRLATAVTRGRNGWYACILTNDVRTD